MGFVQAVILGIVQGLTEWLPISSTAHLRVVPALLHWQDPGAGFTAVIQLGTLLACLIYFRDDLSKAIKGWFRSLSDRQARDTPEARLGWAVFFGTIPIIVLGLAFEKHIKSEWRSLTVVAWALIAIGIVMLIAERFGRKQLKLNDVDPWRGLWVGGWQAIALIPGASRSGSTISGALFCGFERSTAARFSFLLSVPAVAAAGLKELYDERHALLGAGLVPTLVATAVSFVVGYASIAWLIGFLQKRSTVGFVVYRLMIGAALLLLIQQGVLDPMSGLK